MIRTKQCSTILIGVLLWCDVAAVQAQEKIVPKFEVAGGYSVMPNSDAKGSIPKGWFVTVHRNYRNWVGLTWELDGVRSTRHLAFLGRDTEWGTGALLVGPTFSDRRNSRVTPFGRLLGGFASAGNGDDGYGVAIGLQPGVGVDISVGHHTAVRLAADRRSLIGVGTASGATAAHLLLRAGVLVSWGTR